MRNLNLFCLLLLTQVSIGQYYMINNGGSTKEIPQSSAVEVVVSDVTDWDENCCDNLHLLGTLENVKEDSILLKLDALKLTKDFSKSSQLHDSSYFDVSSEKWIAKEDVVYLQKYKSKKQKKNSKVFSGIGAALVIGSALTAANALVFAGDKKKDLLIASGAQFAGGVILGVSFNIKQYRFKGDGRTWKFK